MTKRNRLEALLAISKRTCLALALPCALALAGPAAGATLSSASFGVQIFTLPQAVFPGAGATGTATSNLSAAIGAGTAFNGVSTTTLPTSAAPPLTAVQVFVTKNDAGSFTGATPNQVGGNASIHGVANIFGIGGFTTGGAPLLSIPLNVGTPNTAFKAAGGVAITVIAGAWTAGTAVVTGLGSGYGTPTTATAMGSNGLTVGGAGTLVLVAPIKVISGIAGILPGFGTLTLTYVPEPATLLLLGAGVVGLAALARRRR